jgi:hypothetical protein
MTEYTGEFVDLTPTWTGILPVLITLLTDTPRGSEDRRFIVQEFYRMAHAADLHNAAVRQQRPPIMVEEPHMEAVL